MEQQEAPRLLKVGEVARELRLSTFTVYRRIEAGDLQAVRVGENGPLRIHRTALDRFLIPAAPKGHRIPTLPDTPSRDLARATGATR